MKMVTVLLAILFLSAPLFAGGNFYVRTITVQPKLDGVLDEKEWPVGAALGNFTGVDGKKVSAGTKTWIVQDRGGLWIAVDCEEPHMDRLIGKEIRKGGRTWLDDGVELFLGTFEDSRKYLHIVVNTEGVYFADLAARPALPELVGEWDPAISWACRKYKDRWTAELYIPFASIPRDGDQSWRINICRNRFAGGAEEYSSIVPIKGNFHSPEKFATLKGVLIPKNIKIDSWGNFRCGVIDGILFVKGDAQWKPSPHVTNFMLRFEDSAGRLMAMLPLRSPKLPLDVNIKIPESLADAKMVRVVAVDMLGTPEAISRPLTIRKSSPLELSMRQPYYDIEDEVTVAWSLLEGYANKASALTREIFANSKIMDVVTLSAKSSGTFAWSLKDKPLGKYDMKVTLALKDGRTFTSQIAFEKLPAPAKLHEVTIDKRGVMLVDAKEFLPIGLYRLTPDLWPKYIPGSGFNTVHDMGAGAGRFKRNGDEPIMWDGIDKIQRIMDEAEKVGVKVLFEVGVYVKNVMEVERGEEDAARLREVVSRFRRHPALLAYYLIDEPYSKDYKRAARAREIIRQIDPYHPTVSPSLGYDYSYKPTADLADVLLVSCYPILPGKPEAAEVSRRLEIVRSKVGPDKPIWFVPQAVGMLPKYYNPNYRGDKNKYVFPTADQEQSMVYQSFVKGNARGLVFFAWFGDKPRQSGPVAMESPQFWKELTALTNQLQQNKNLVFAENIDSVKKKTDDGIELSVRKADGAAWIIAVNTLNRRGKLTVNLPKNFLGGWTEINKNSTPHYDEKSLTDKFGPWEVKIWKGPVESLQNMEINAAYMK